MLHTKLHQNRMINKDFRKIWKEREGTKPSYFQKVEIIFENQRFLVLFDSITNYVKF